MKCKTELHTSLVFSPSKLPPHPVPLMYLSRTSAAAIPILDESGVSGNGVSGDMGNDSLEKGAGAGVDGSEGVSVAAVDVAVVVTVCSRTGDNGRVLVVVAEGVAGSEIDTRGSG